MSGGRSAIRGFLIQTLVAVVDSFATNAWTSITIEPDEGNEKIDIRWVGPDEKRAVQVKSSRQQISEPKAKSVVEALKENAEEFDSYELVLAAPVSRSLQTTQELDGVRLTIKGLNEIEMLEHAAFRLDVFLESAGITKTPTQVRTLLIRALSEKFLEMSVEGQTLSREELTRTLLDWILLIYPNAVLDSRIAKCEIACGIIVCHLQEDGSIQLHIDAKFVNYKDQQSIIQAIVVRVLVGPKVTCKLLGHAFAEGGFTFEEQVPPKQLKPLTPFVVMPMSVLERTLLAIPYHSVEGDTVLSDKVYELMGEDKFRFQLHFKYHNDPDLVLAYEGEYNFSLKDLREKGKSNLYDFPLHPELVSSL